MTQEEKEMEVDIVATKGIFLQKKDCLDNGSDLVLEVIKRGKWEHGANDTIIYKGWRIRWRKKDDLYGYSHRKVSKVDIVSIDGKEEKMTLTLTRLNGFNRRTHRTAGLVG